MFSCVLGVPTSIVICKNTYSNDAFISCTYFVFNNFISFSCLGVAARETALALKTLAQAARGVAASTSDPQAASDMLDSARDVMDGSAKLIQEAKQALVAPGDAEVQQRLAQVSHKKK